MTKQAVLIIHGIGNQRPMETLRSFVQAVWSSDSSLHRNHAQGASIWSKPYALSQDFELRRLTTAENKAGLKTDFFEFYWAHLMQGTKIKHVVSWARSVLWRAPASVPKPLRLLYWVLWLAAIGGLAVSALMVLHASTGVVQPWWLKWSLGLIVVPTVTMVLTDIVGDAARYLHVAPANIQSRNAIRAAGLKVLDALHQKGYERIVVVGHSLGTVIAYDILTHAWAAMSGSEPTATGQTLEAVEELERMAARGKADPVQWQAAQHRLFGLRVATGARWRVSDFVSMGSPLAHAQVLLAANAHELKQRVADREFLACPPALEATTAQEKPWIGFSYPANAAARHLHHAAVFAVTRWTNLYFPNRLLLRGDLVGGKVAPVFGLAVHDVPVSTRRWYGLLSHTFYWRPDPPNQHIDALRRALDLLDNENQPIP